VTLSRDKANDLMSNIDRDIPAPYVFVCAVLININLYLHSFATGLKWSIWMYESGGYLVWKEPRMYMELIGLYLYSAIFAMLFDISTVMYNPFGPQVIDIEHFKVGSSIRNFAKQLRKADYPNTMTDPPEGSSALFPGDDNDDDEHGAWREHQMAMLTETNMRRSSRLLGSLLDKI